MHIGSKEFSHKDLLLRNRRENFPILGIRGDPLGENSKKDLSLFSLLSFPSLHS